MTQPAKANEPSMEEILASIRRIIADDDATKPTPAAEAADSGATANFVAPSPVPPAPSGSIDSAPAAVEAQSASEPNNDAATDNQSVDILELTEQMANPASEAPRFRTIEGGSDIGFAESADRPAPQAFSDAAPRLLSRSTSAAVDSAFNSLAQTVLVHNARTLEDLVREMLRPLLKSWLDDNLPGLVERLVRAEIERVSRGG